MRAETDLGLKTQQESCKELHQPDICVYVD